MVTKIGSGTGFIADIANETYLLGEDAVLKVPTGQFGIDALDLLGGRSFVIRGRIVEGGQGITIQNDEGAAADKIVVASSGVVATEGAAISVGSGRVTIENAGRISSDTSVALGYTGQRLTLINTGIMTSQDEMAILSRAAFTKADNQGTIHSDTGDGIEFRRDFLLTNSGAIHSNDGNGILLADGASTGRIVNTGTISGGTAAIRIATNNDDGEVLEVVNRGQIIGGINFALSNNDDSVDTAGGKVIGDIQGSEGDNLFVLTNSVVTGDVYGASGDDTYVVSTQNITLLEFALGGTDTIRSSANFSILALANFENIALTGKKDVSATGNDSDNRLTGNSGDNALTGRDGTDTLRGGKGDDKLNGGDAADIFIFKTGDGTDRIENFQFTLVDMDVVDLSGLKSIKNFNDLKNNHLEQVGDNVVIDGLKGDKLVFLDADIEAVNATFFTF
jgi:Ca2+-binding RTX toxin-like protein